MRPLWHKTASLLLAMSAGLSQLGQAQTLTRDAYFAGQNSFAHNLLQQALQSSEENTNVFLSPLSANLALAMLLDGARGTTRGVMLEGLGLSAATASDELHAQNANYMAALDQNSAGLTVSINNGLWADKRFPLLADFASRLQQYYGAQVANADFKFEAPLVASNINQWASESTHGKIQSVVDADTVSRLDMLLANATYFKGTWKQEFAKDKTSERSFQTEGGAAPVGMMHGQVRALYKEDGYQAIRLPYKGDKVSMYVILPPEGSQGREWTSEHVLQDAFWQALDEGMHADKVNLRLPKFRLKQSAILNDSLKAMGFADIFGSPDFSGLSTAPTQVSYVKQDSFVQVDEEGTEAAAVTTIGIRTTAVGPLRQTNMYVDRPFFVAIRDDVNKSFLFMGYIANPQW